jgi:kynurenine formamidase
MEKKRTASAFCWWSRIFGYRWKTEREGEYMRKRRFVDLSLAIESGLRSDPPKMIPKIDYINHIQGVEEMKSYFPGLTSEHLPNGLGWAVEVLTLTTHSGTHLDAPYHYHPTMDKGKLSLTIDQIPLDWCFSNGVVLDFRHKADGERIPISMRSSVSTISPMS